MFTEQEVDSFIESYPINTNGSIGKHQISKTHFNDGGTGWAVEYPYWPANNSVAKGVLKAALAAVDLEASVYFFSEKLMTIIFTENECDPD